MTIFRERSEQAIDRLKAMKAKCLAEGREPNTAEREEANRLLELVEGIEAGADLAAHQPLVAGRPDPQAAAPGAWAPAAATPGRGALRGPGEAKTFAALFGAPAGRAGWKDSSEFFRVVASGRFDPRLIRASINEGTGSEGGFLVPEEFSKEVHDVALEDEVVLPRARVQPMGSDTIKLPAFEIGSHAGHLYGGLVAYWTTEAGSLTESQPKMRQMELNARKLTVLMKYSSEWAEDAPGGERNVARVAGKGLGWYRDRALLKGTGAGQPQGVLNAPCLITVAKETGQLADTINYDNLVNMLARLHPSSWRGSVWVAHTSTVPQLLTMGIMVGVGGTHYPVLKEESGQFSMLGRPVVFTEKLEPLGDKGDLLLADFSQYIVGLRRELRFETSIGPGFSTDEVYARLIGRLDGQALWSEALTLSDGATTVGPFVTLEARG
jgi:HK97 family phage major capsid protein